MAIIYIYIYISVSSYSSWDPRNLGRRSHVICFPKIIVYFPPWGIPLGGIYKRWCPPSYKLVISPLTINISPINHSYWSYNQLSYLGGTTL